MRHELNIGIIGLDTSHVSAFARLLNDPADPHHIPGGRVIAAYPGGSPDFELSWSRVSGFTKELKENRGVEIMDSPEAVAERCDAILLTAVDGRVHLDLFERISRYRRPTFIDKPFAVSSADAAAMAALAREAGTSLMSASSLRFAEGLESALANKVHGPMIGADFFGPMELQPTQPGLFWYGVHTVEMLYAALGRGCRQVTAVTQPDHELIVGTWADGRIGTIRGNRGGNTTFGGLVHRAKGTLLVDTSQDTGRPKYARLLDRVMTMFATGTAAVDLAETVETIRFIEAANESRSNGQPVALAMTGTPMSL